MRPRLVGGLGTYPTYDMICGLASRWFPLYVNRGGVFSQKAPLSISSKDLASNSYCSCMMASKYIAPGPRPYGGAG